MQNLAIRIYMPSVISNDKSKTTYIYKQHKLYGRVIEQNFELFENNKYILANDKKSEIIDILPEGIDLQIMLRLFNAREPIELLPYLKNTIGDFDFSTSPNKTHFDKPIMSNLTLESRFPNILPCEIEITPSHLQPSLYATNGIQNLSLSGYQHKLQVSIIDNVVREDYGDFILKPNSERFWNLPLNEHLNVSFMQEFGFEVPFNAIIYDKWQGNFNYLIKRFDIDENGNKLPQISLNALMGSEDKYDGNIEQISTFLKDRLDSTQKMQFLKFIYTNALLYNNDLHKKNIGFIFKDNKLHLSPVYDILNIYAVKPVNKMDLLGKEQCHLSIKGHNNGIRISYFKQSSKNIGLDFDKVQSTLNEMQDIYLKKYPQYIEKLMESPNINNILYLKEKLLESHKRCLQVANNEAKNRLHSIQKDSGLTI